MHMHMHPLPLVLPILVHHTHTYLGMLHIIVYSMFHSISLSPEYCDQHEGMAASATDSTNENLTKMLDEFLFRHAHAVCREYS
jgi:hypothetical protein